MIKFKSSKTNDILEEFVNMTKPILPFNSIIFKTNSNQLAKLKSNKEKFSLSRNTNRNFYKSLDINKISTQIINENLNSYDKKISLNNTLKFSNQQKLKMNNFINQNKKLIDNPVNLNVNLNLKVDVNIINNMNNLNNLDKTNKNSRNNNSVTNEPNITARITPRMTPGINLNTTKKIIFSKTQIKIKEDSSKNNSNFNSENKINLKKNIHLNDLQSKLDSDKIIKKTQKINNKQKDSQSVTRYFLIAKDLNDKKFKIKNQIKSLGEETLKLIKCNIKLNEKEMSKSTQFSQLNQLNRMNRMNNPTRQLFFNAGINLNKIKK